MMPSCSPLFYIGRFLFRVLFRLLGRWEVFGHGNVPETGGAVIAPNHCSYLDPPVVGSALKRPTFFMGKKELFRIPVLSWIIRRTGCFPVDRDRQDKEAVRTALDLLKGGKLLVMFPEGTRSPDGTLQEALGIGVTLVANRAGVPIVPAFVRGTRQAWAPGTRPLRRADISVTFGPPLETVLPGGHKANKEQLQELTQRVMAEIARLGAGGADDP